MKTLNFCQEHKILTWAYVMVYMKSSNNNLSSMWTKYTYKTFFMLYNRKKSTTRQNVTIKSFLIQSSKHFLMFSIKAIHLSLKSENFIASLDDNDREKSLVDTKKISFCYLQRFLQLERYVRRFVQTFLHFVFFYCRVVLKGNCK